MLNRRKLLIATAATALAGRAAAAERVGATRLVQIWATRAPDGAATSAALYQGDDLFLGDALATVEDGGLIARFEDGAELRMGSQASLVIDEFTVGGDGAFRSSVFGGIARYISGEIRSGFLVTTPTTTIGIRGTDFSVWVERDEPSRVAGRTTIWVNSGAVIVTPTAGGDAAEVGYNETVRVDVGATTVMRDAPRPPSDRGLLPALRPGRTPDFRE